MRVPELELRLRVAGQAGRVGAQELDRPGRVALVELLLRLDGRLALESGEEVDGVARPYVAAALNCDVDNHADLRSAEELAFAAEVTTDVKVIPETADGAIISEA